MKKTGKILSVFLAAAILGSTAPISAGAAAPAVTTDETMYVNLDYYGKSQKVNVVKDCSLNGNREITDYGNYRNVLNMSNAVKPDVSGGKVTWDLPQNMQNFYYQCTLKNQSVPLPWTFDVSYKLNGVPAEAGKLAGASGLVEIDIKATPNKKVSDYLKDNMLLEVGVVFKMKDTTSVEAPGSQLQTLGEYKAIFFSAVPGEEKEFVIRVGTKKFDIPGIIMMMEPGTLSDFKDIKDLKTDKDKVINSINAINNSTNSIVDTLQGMTNGIGETESGLNQLNGARGYISSSKGSVYQSADSAIASLSPISRQMAAMVPHMQKGQQLIQDVNSDLNALTASVSNMSPKLSALSGDLGAVQTDSSKLQNDLNSLYSLSGSRQSVSDRVKSKLGDLQGDLDTLQKDLKKVSSAAKDLKDNSAFWDSESETAKKSIGDLEDILSEIEQSPLLQEIIKSKIVALPPQEQGIIFQQIAELEKEIAQDIGKFNDDSDNLFDKDVSSGLSGLLKNLYETLDDVDGTDTTGYIKTAQDVVNEVEDYCNVLDGANQHSENLLKNANHVSADLQSLLDSSQSIITNIKALNSTSNQYKGEMVNTLKDTAQLDSSLTSGIGSTQNFLSSLKNFMQTSGGKLDSAAKASLDGSINILQNSLGGIGKSGTIKDASNAIDQTANQEINQYEKDNNLLKLNYDAKPVSFTSSKNPAPSSIQIVMRTKEISTENNSLNIQDQEKAEQYVSPLEKIQKIFTKIRIAIQSIFSGS